MGTRPRVKAKDAGIAATFLLSFLLISSIVCCTAAPYLNATRCNIQLDCPSDKFCARSIRSQVLGACEGCWQCCLFPNVYGTATCSSRCRCGLGRKCSLNSDCGPGEFCGVLSSRSDLPTCQLCTACRIDSQAWRGSCAAACPSGALGDNGVMAGAEGQYVFAAFDIRDHPDAREGLTTTTAPPGQPQGGAVVGVKEDALRLWLGDLPPYVLGVLLPPPPLPGRLNDPRVAPPPPAGSGPSRVIPLGEFAARLAAVLPSPDPVCPRPQPGTQEPLQLQLLPGGMGSAAVGSSQLPNSTTATAAAAAAGPAFSSLDSNSSAVRVVPASCPCNPMQNASSFRCPAGHRCSPRAWLSLPADVVTLGSTALLKARCVACELGSYCPEGTYVEERDENVRSLDCPAGQFCVAPSDGLDCPAGFFCPTRSTSPITCRYEELLQNPTASFNPLFRGSVESREALKRLMEDREPVRGNYCPNGSVLPTRRCRAGHYCPDPSLELPCTPGHYCRAEQVAPAACPPLTLCNGGSIAPRVWPAAVASFCGVLALAVVFSVVLRCLDRSKDAPETDQERRSRGERALRDLVAYLNRRPVTAACPELSAIQRYHLGVEHLTWRANGQPQGHLVLNGVSGRFLAGHLSAILGPSGCGKSSLLSLLAGRAPRGATSGGTVTLRNEGSNTQHEVRDARDICYVVGFVPQDDIVCADLTIRENLEYSAALRLPMRRSERKAAPGGPDEASGEEGPGNGGSGGGGGGVDRPAGRKPPAVGWDRLPRSLRAPMAMSSPAERHKVVNEVLGMMALRSAQSYRVGSVEARIISGGQRKRVNIGVELVSRPPLLFLDEPTSGLDASCSNVVLRSLLGLAVNGGVNVVAVIHQPRHSVFNMFQEVHLLGEGGSTVYHGAPGKVREYFEGLMYFFPPYENVADTLLDIVTGKLVNKRCLTKDLPRRWRERINTAGSSGTVAGSVAAVLSLYGEVVPASPTPAPASPAGLPSGAASPQTSHRPLPSPFANMSWCSSVEGPLPTGDSLEAAAVGGGSVASFGSAAAGGGLAAGSDIYRPEFTEDIKDILEAEFDRLVRSRLSYSASAAWRASLGHWTVSGSPAALARSPTGRSLTAAALSRAGTGGGAAEGLTLDQLRQLFVKLGQEGEDAELLVAMVAQVHRAQQGPLFQLSYNERETVVSKTLLIDTLLRVAQGDLRVPSPGELRAQAAAAAAAAAAAQGEERRVLRRMASAASSSLETLTHKFLRAAPNIFNRNPMSRSPSMLGMTPSLDFASSLVPPPSVAGAPGGAGGQGQGGLDTRVSVGSSIASVTGRSRTSLSNLPFLGRLLHPYAGTKLSPATSKNSAAGSTAAPPYGNGGGPSSSGGAGGAGGDDGAVHVCVHPDLRDAAEAGVGQSATSSSRLGRVEQVVGHSNLLSRLARASVESLHRNRSGLAFGRSPAGSSRFFLGGAEAVRTNNRDAGSMTEAGNGRHGGDVDGNGACAGFGVRSSGLGAGDGGGSDGGGGAATAAAPLLGARDSICSIVGSEGDSDAKGLMNGESEGNKDYGSDDEDANGNGNDDDGDGDGDGAVPPSRAAVISIQPPSLGRSRRGRFKNEEVEAAIAAAAVRFQLTKAHASSFRSPNMGFGGTRESGLVPLVADTITEEEEGASRANDSTGNSAYAADGAESSAAAAGGGGAAAAASDGRQGGNIAAWAPAAAGDYSYGGGGSGQAQSAKGSSSPSVAAAWQRVLHRVRSNRFAAATPTALTASTITEEDPAAAASGVDAVGGRAAASANADGGGGGGGRTTVYGGGGLPLTLSAASAIIIGGGAAAEDDAASVAGSCAPNGMYDSNGIMLDPKRRFPSAFAPALFVDAKAGGYGGALGTAFAYGPGHGSGGGGGGGDGFGGGGGGGARSLGGVTTGSLRKGDSGGGEGSKGAGSHDAAAASYSNTGWLSHLWIFFRRSVVQASRTFWPVTVLEVALLLAAAAAVGSNQGTQWGPTDVPGNTIMAMMCLAVLAVVQHLRTFTTNRLVLRRERGAGLSPTAYFTARSLVDLPWILAAPAIFTLPYYVLTVPRARFSSYYAIAVGVWWWASGLAYLLSDSPLMPHAAAPTAAVLVTLIAGALLNGGGTPSLAEARGTVAAAVLGVSYNRWALEAITVTELDHYMVTHRNVVAVMYRNKGICGLDRNFQGDLLQPDDDATGGSALSLLRLSTDFTRGYCRNSWRTALIALFSLGMALRLLAMLALKYDAEIVLCRDCVVHWWRSLTWRDTRRAAAEAAAEDEDGRSTARTQSLMSATPTSPAIGRSGGGAATAAAAKFRAEVSIVLQPEGSTDTTWLQPPPGQRQRQGLTRLKALSWRRSSSLTSRASYGAMSYTTQAAGALPATYSGPELQGVGSGPVIISPAASVVARPAVPERPADPLAIRLSSPEPACVAATAVAAAAAQAPRGPAVASFAS